MKKIFNSCLLHGCVRKCIYSGVCEKSCYWYTTARLYNVFTVVSVRNPVTDIQQPGYTMYLQWCLWEIPLLIYNSQVTQCIYSGVCEKSRYWYTTARLHNVFTVVSVRNPVTDIQQPGYTMYLQWCLWEIPLLIYNSQVTQCIYSGVCEKSRYWYTTARLHNVFTVVSVRNPVTDIQQPGYTMYLQWCLWEIPLLIYNSQVTQCIYSGVCEKSRYWYTTARLHNVFTVVSVRNPVTDIQQPGYTMYLQWCLWEIPLLIYNSQVTQCIYSGVCEKSRYWYTTARLHNVFTVVSVRNPVTDIQQPGYTMYLQWCLWEIPLLIYNSQVTQCIYSGVCEKSRYWYTTARLHNVFTVVSVRNPVTDIQQPGYTMYLQWYLWEIPLLIYNSQVTQCIYSGVCEKSRYWYTTARLHNVFTVVSVRNPVTDIQQPGYTMYLQWCLWEIPLLIYNSQVTQCIYSGVCEKSRYWYTTARLHNVFTVVSVRNPVTDIQQPGYTMYLQWCLWEIPLLIYNSQVTQCIYSGVCEKSRYWYTTARLHNVFTVVSVSHVILLLPAGRGMSVLPRRPYSGSAHLRRHSQRIWLGLCWPAFVPSSNTRGSSILMLSKNWKQTNVCHYLLRRENSGCLSTD